MGFRNRSGNGTTGCNDFIVCSSGIERWTGSSETLRIGNLTFPLWAVWYLYHHEAPACDGCVCASWECLWSMSVLCEISCLMFDVPCVLVGLKSTMTLAGAGCFSLLFCLLFFTFFWNLGYFLFFQSNGLFLFCRFFEKCFDVRII